MSLCLQSLYNNWGHPPGSLFLFFFHLQKTDSKKKKKKIGTIMSEFGSSPDRFPSPTHPEVEKTTARMTKYLLACGPITADTS